jgi:hypothetical protein
MGQFRLFQAYGVEIEYMVVDRDTLRVSPVVDRLLHAASSLPGAALPEDEDAQHPGSVELGDIAWSNELALHVLEFKTNSPAPSLDSLASNFHASVVQANALLAPLNACLLPGGMHPTMNPDADMRLWPHGYNDVYAAFNRIFNCKGHGWANLQSAHLNLPFDGDEEFGKLHAAIRFLLPIMPALAAASPVMDSTPTGLLDNRLEVYRQNAKAVPITSGRVIPEPVYTKADYERVIFGAIYKAFEPRDPEGVLRHEWCNSRGAIARFSRDSIEVRVLDCQECPRADLAIIALVSSAIKAITQGRMGDLANISSWQVDPLAEIFLSTVRNAEQTVISNGAYLEALGFPGRSASADELWSHILSRTLATEPGYAEHAPALNVILNRGTLSRRIMARLGNDVSAGNIGRVWRELAELLRANRLLGE